ncbi:MAG: bifunctional phosphoribosylaminoimidazolecarboxamide formyltransferase/IMP cyclohydrolase [Coriobacteriia bacterium]|nr:bifunctional phosphoribosylaminoimidazolecarboxamide formyltransferase/IMP cyclohydrolase [Coriobacteriia bacterium]
MTQADHPIKRALISVTNKEGVAEFARALHDEFGVEIVSTGGTAKALEAEGIAVRAIDDLTGFPEMMDGRVKTLHPRVHGGLLARRDDPTHLEQAAEHAIGLIDLVVVNLYAFEATVAKPGVSYEEAIEKIDIGGPSMLRSAAKNHSAVTVVINPTHYELILTEMRSNSGATTLATRKQLACEVFQATSAYDNAIYNWLFGALATGEAATPYRQDKRLFLSKVQDLRYGENPHQSAAFYKLDGGGNANTLANATQHQGKELSFNNYLDLDAAWAAVREFSALPTVVIIKHLTPCGVASHSSLATAYQRAFDCDPVSAFGGVMAFNCPVGPEVIEAIYANGQFIEALIAPEYEAAALELLAQKPDVRVLSTQALNEPGVGFDYRSVEGGMLCMQADAVLEDEAGFTVASIRQPSAEELADLVFAWKVCKSVKSNAIVVVKDGVTLGIGAGQPNRVNSARLAATQAGAGAEGAAAASDAFMPFADSLEVLAAAGVTAVIQPGGSMRDQEVLAAANAANMAVVFTGTRHFRH